MALRNNDCCRVMFPGAQGSVGGRCAEDMECAKKLDPKNPHLVVNYTQVYDIECIELCKVCVCVCLCVCVCVLIYLCACVCVRRPETRPTN